MALPLHPVHPSSFHAAQGVTIAGTTGAAFLWGIHAGDLYMAISSMAAVAGVALQFYLAFKKKQ